MISALIALGFGYLCGSIPSGIIVTRLAGVEDPRSVGSKNIGATNVLRTGRKDLAALTLLADMLKGTVATLIAAQFAASGPWSPDVFAAAGAFLGHLYPLFLGFRGGKGVATFLGCLLALAWPVALIFILVWLAVALLTRYSSAAALCASLVTPIVIALSGRHDVAILFVLLTAAVWIKHRTNIERLRAGTESKIDQKSRAPVP